MGFRLRRDRWDLEVDVLALPTTATEPATVTDLDMAQGFADTPALHTACRFAFLGNLTGLPCGTAPVGLGDAGLLAHRVHAHASRP